MLSIISPAYNEQSNLFNIYERICKVMKTIDYDWEWLIIDDHSKDNTFKEITNLATQDPRVRGIRLSKNFGSHSAYQCGIANATGKAIIGISSDGQDPPELIPELVNNWEKGYQVIWAARNATNGDIFLSNLSSKLYYLIMRHFAKMQDIPKRGADFFLIDGIVGNALNECSERKFSIFAMITWMGFNQNIIYYDRAPRLSGSSGWTFSKKIKLLIDSILGFSYFPIRVMGAIGAIVAILGLIYIPYLIANVFMGNPIPGWSELMVVILILGGVQMLMLAILGEYVWRNLEESRNRPNFLIERVTEFKKKKE